MIFDLIRNGGIGAYAAIAVGLLGTFLGVLALGALVGQSRSTFSLGVVTLALAAATAGAGMLGTLYGRSQTERALGYVGSGLDQERIHRAGFREAQASSWVGFFAALLPFALGGAAALLGSRFQRPQSRVQGFAEPVVASDDGLGPTLVAGVFFAIAGLAAGGAWAMSHSELPKLRYAIDETDAEAWHLAAALEDVKDGKRRNACERLSEALLPFWDQQDRRQWPRTMRPIHPELAAWRAAADACAKRIIESFDGGGPEPTWTQDLLLDSPLLQDEGLHTRALAWGAQAFERPANLPPEPNPASGSSIPKEAIARAVRADLKAIQACYERALRQEPTLEGKVVVEFAIGPDGKVASVEDASDPAFPSPAVTSCILARIRGLRFPRPNGGGEVIVKYPFIFKTAP